MGLRIRPIRPDEIPTAAHLVAGVFRQNVAPLFTSDGVREFTAYAASDAFAHRLRADHIALVAINSKSGAIVGMVEIRKYRHISLLFVETDLQRQGIGRRLVAAAVEVCKEKMPELTAITVNASPNSVKAYEKFGFAATEPEQEKNGIRFVPMALPVESSGGV